MANRLASGANDNTARLWDVKTGREVSRFTGHTDGVDSVVFSPDGRFLASGANDNTLWLWDVETGSQVGLLIIVFYRITLKVNAVESLALNFANSGCFGLFCNCFFDFFNNRFRSIRGKSSN